MKNYYKILQVDKDASPEIIKVAYKLLVKKNHPDLKEGEEKKDAEEKIKEINEAYDVLSNPAKKAEYDQTINIETISNEQYESILVENQNLKNELTYYKNYFNQLNNRTTYTKTQNKNMYDNNMQDTSNNTQKNTDWNIDTIKFYIKEKTKTFIAILITLLIVFIIYNIPFIHQYISNLFDGKFLFFIVVLIFSYFYFFLNIE